MQTKLLLSLLILFITACNFKDLPDRYTNRPAALRLRASRAFVLKIEGQYDEYKSSWSFNALVQETNDYKLRWWVLGVDTSVFVPSGLVWITPPNN